MRNIKSSLLMLFVILASVSSIIIQDIANANDVKAKLYVAPQKTSGIAVGDTFSIDIYVTGVTHLWGYELKLWYDPSVLTANSSTPNPDFPDISYNEIDDEYNSTHGLVWVSSSLPMGTYIGLNGSLTLATIRFSVEATGESPLNIDESYPQKGQLACLGWSPYGEWGYPTQIPTTIFDGYFSTAPVDVHDVAVTNVTASPTKVSPGGSVSVNVIVANEGDFTETFDVTVTYDETVIKNETDISLASGTNKTLNFTWNTTGLADGVYTIKAEVILELDNDPRNNTGTVKVTVGAIHDVAVTNVTASPTKVSPGGSVSVNVIVANEGDFTETFDVTVTYDGTFIGTETDVPLAPGDSTTLSFTWDTTNMLEGEYTVRAEAIVDVDDDRTNNAFNLPGTITITGAAAEGPDILLYVVAGIAIVVVVALLLFYVLKIRKPT